jgi:metal-dependent amidase/aminoacylase/carboxypeptidase family protein
MLTADASYAAMRHHRVLARVYARNAATLGRWFPDLGDLLAYGIGSSDMGNVSQVVPSIHPAIGIESLPAVNHHREFTAHCMTAAAERGLVDGAVALAWTAIDVSQDGALAERLTRGDRG